MECLALVCTIRLLGEGGWRTRRHRRWRRRRYRRRYRRWCRWMRWRSGNCPSRLPYMFPSWQWWHVSCLSGLNHSSYCWGHKGIPLTLTLPRSAAPTHFSGCPSFFYMYLMMSLIDLAVFAVISGFLLDTINSQRYEGESGYLFTIIPSITVGPWHT